MKISIVIPTLNEEKDLAYLLEDLKNQTFTDFEVIVADAGSNDNTIKRARSYNAMTVKGGLPAAGRNAGARKAAGEFIFFLDADVRILPSFLETAYAEILERNLDIATCEFKPQSDFVMDTIIHYTANIFVTLNQYSDPHAPGFCIFVRKSVFEAVGGFDETLQLAEDHDFVKRVAAEGTFRVLKEVYVKVSVRRLDKEGRLNYIRKVFQVELYRAFVGEVDKDIVEYEFGNFSEETSSRLSKKLMKFEKKLKSINKKINRIEKKYINSDEIIENYFRINKRMKKSIHTIYRKMRKRLLKIIQSMDT